jgi:hypothetical protein
VLGQQKKPFQKRVTFAPETRDDLNGIKVTKEPKNPSVFEVEQLDFQQQTDVLECSQALLERGETCDILREGKEEIYNQPKNWEKFSLYLKEQVYKLNPDSPLPVGIRPKGLTTRIVAGDIDYILHYCPRFSKKDKYCGVDLFKCAPMRKALVEFPGLERINTWRVYVSPYGQFICPAAYYLDRSSSLEDPRAAFPFHLTPYRCGQCNKSKVSFGNCCYRKQRPREPSAPLIFNKPIIEEKSEHVIQLEPDASPPVEPLAEPLLPPVHEDRIVAPENMPAIKAQDDTAVTYIPYKTGSTIGFGSRHVHDTYDYVAVPTALRHICEKHFPRLVFPNENGRNSYLLRVSEDPKYREFIEPYILTKRGALVDWWVLVIYYGKKSYGRMHHDFARLNENDARFFKESSTVLRHPKFTYNSLLKSILLWIWAAVMSIISLPHRLWFVQSVLHIRNPHDEAGISTVLNPCLPVRMSHNPPDNMLYSLLGVRSRTLVYIEELLKCIPGMAYIIGFIETVLYDDWRHFHWHVASMSRSFLPRVVYHLRANQITVPGEDDVPNEPLGPNQIREQKLLLTEPLPLIPDSHLAIWNKKYPNVATQNNGKSPYEDKDTYVHIACYPLTKMKIPSSRGIEHSLACVFTKLVYPAARVKTIPGLRSDKYGNTITRPLTLLALQRISEQFNFTLLRDRGNDYLEEQSNFFSSLRTDQKLAIIRDLEKESLGEIIDTITISTKNDESLLCSDKFIKRNLTALTGRPFYTTSPTVSALSKHISTKVFSFDGECPVKTFGQTWYFYYTSGSTSRTLTKFATRAARNPTDWYVLIMGDDMLAFKNGDAFECDFSNYDRTQNKQLRALVYDILKANGFGSLVKFIEQYYTANWKWGGSSRNQTPLHSHLKKLLRTAQTFVDGKMTGEALTTLGNSLMNMILTIYALSEDPYNLADTSLRYAHCGVIAKYKVHQDPLYKGDFLKGSFMHHDGKYKWIRKPSFLCKLGHSRSDYHKLMMKPHWTEHERAVYYLRCQWLSFGPIEQSCWFYKQMHRILFADTSIGTGTAVETPKSWQVTQTPTSSIPNWVFNHMIQHHYGLDVQHMEMFLDTFESALAVAPSVYESFMVSTIASKDY